MTRFNKISRGDRSAGRGQGQSVRNVNLTRLAQATSPELLASALVLREEAIKSYLQGELIRGETAQHINEQLADAGFPAGWLDTPELPIAQEMLSGLMELVAMSKEKAPLRRANLLKLAEAFNNKVGLLAEAIEIVETSLHTILDGTSRFDDTRMWHINPLLMQAGFPNGWLEMPNAPLEPEWVTALEARATDAAELAFEEEARAQTSAIVEVAAPVTPATPIAGDAASTPAPSPQAAALPTKPEAPAAPAAKPSKIPRGAQKAARPLLAPQVSPDGKPATKLPPHKQLSVNRAAALTKILDTARRGTKVFLWREVMGKGLPYAANIRSGDIIFNDVMAREVCQALELPEGWLDNPVFPPKTLAAWVTDNSVPFPAVDVVKAKLKADPVAQKSSVRSVEDPSIHGLLGRSVQVLHKGGLRAAPADNSATVHAGAPTPPASRTPKIIAKKPAAPSASAEPAATPAPVVVEEKINIPQFLAKTPIVEQPSAPAAAPERATPPAGRPLLTWTPVSGAPRTTPGPAAAALAATLMQFSCDGTLSEADAAQLLASLLTT